MKTTTPTKASTPTKPTLPRIVEGCDEDTSEDVSPDGEKAPSAIDTEEEIDKQEITVVVPVLCKAKEPSERDVRRQDYQSARMHRRASSGFSAVTGVITLFQHISEIRTDLEWVEIKAYFRQRNLSYLSWEEHMKDRSGKQPLPIVSYLLILLCTGLLVYSFYKSGWKFEKMSVNPSFGPAVDTLTDLGALSAAKIIQDNEWYRAITATVLHGGVLH